MTTGDAQQREGTPYVPPPGFVNVDQAEGWDAEEGNQWVAYEERYNASVRRYHHRLFDAARIAASDHVLDIGCGCGETTREAARCQLGRAFGVDLSARMIARARERSRAEGLTNVRFKQADAQVYPFDAQAFDLAISRFGAMFFADPVAAFRNIGRAVRPGGRLALLAWQTLDKNEWLLALRQVLAMGRTLPQPRVGTPGPWGLADPAAVRRLLVEAGFEDIGFEDVSEPYTLGTSGEDAFAFVRSMAPVQGLLEDLDETATAQALTRLRTMLVTRETGEGVLFNASAWLITARRRV